MKKGTLIFVSLMIGASASLAFAAGAKESTQAAKPVSHLVIRAGSPNPANNSFSQLLFAFAKKMKQESNGRIQVKVYTSGQLGNENDLIKGMTLGNVDMAVDALGLYATYEPLVGVTSIPFEWKNYAQVHKALDGGIVGKTLEQDVLKQSGIRILGFPDGLFREMYLTKSIKSVSDLHGMKIRAPQIPTYINLITDLGADPVPLPWSQIYTSMKTGVIQGAEGPIDGAYEAGFQEVAKAVVVTNHIYSPTTLAIRNSLYSTLPKSDQDLINKVTKQVIAQANAQEGQLQNSYLQKFKAAGVKIERIDMAPFRKDTASMKTNFEKKYGEPARKLIQEIEAAGRAS